MHSSDSPCRAIPCCTQFDAWGCASSVSMSQTLGIRLIALSISAIRRIMLSLIYVRPEKRCNSPAERVARYAFNSSSRIFSKYTATSSSETFPLSNSRSIYSSLRSMYCMSISFAFGFLKLPFVVHFLYRARASNTLSWNLLIRLSNSSSHFFCRFSTSFRSSLTRPRRSSSTEILCSRSTLSSPNVRIADIEASSTVSAWDRETISLVKT